MLDLEFDRTEKGSDPFWSKFWIEGNYPNLDYLLEQLVNQIC